MHGKPFQKKDSNNTLTNLQKECVMHKDTAKLCIDKNGICTVTPEVFLNKIIEDYLGTLVGIKYTTHNRYRSYLKSCLSSGKNVVRNKRYLWDGFTVYKNLLIGKFLESMSLDDHVQGSYKLIIEDFFLGKGSCSIPLLQQFISWYMFDYNWINEKLDDTEKRNVQNRKYIVSEEMEEKIDYYLRKNHNLSPSSFRNLKLSIRKAFVTGIIPNNSHGYAIKKFFIYANINKKEDDVSSDFYDNYKSNSNQNFTGISPENFLETYKLNGCLLPKEVRNKIAYFISTNLSGCYSKDILYLQSVENSIYDLYSNVIDSFVETYHGVKKETPKESEEILDEASEEVDEICDSKSDTYKEEAENEIKIISKKIKYIKDDIQGILNRLNTLEKLLGSV